jgi:hypothetical protein
MNERLAKREIKTSLCSLVVTLLHRVDGANVSTSAERARHDGGWRDVVSRALLALLHYSSDSARLATSRSSSRRGVV